MSTNDKPTEDGFEYLVPGQQEATFFRWHVTDGSKDLLLIDRFTAMPVHEFFELIEDNFDRGRAPVLLAMIATSVRNRFPEWSVERVARLVMNVNLSDVAFIDADAEEAEVPTPPAEEPASDGTSSSDESKPTSSETSPETSETSNETPD